MENKDKVIAAINSILSAVVIHKSALTTFIAGDGEKLQQIEQENNSINIIFNNEEEVWGINALALLDTIVNTLTEDNLLFTTNEKGILTKAMWKSEL